MRQARIRSITFPALLNLCVRTLSQIQYCSHFRRKRYIRSRNNPSTGSKGGTKTKKRIKYHAITELTSNSPNRKWRVASSLISHWVTCHMHIYLDKIIVLQILFWWLYLQGRERYEVTDFIFQGASWTSRMDRSCQHVYRLQMDFLAKTAMPFSAHLHTPTYMYTYNLLTSIRVSYKRNKCRKVYTISPSNNKRKKIQQQTYKN